jgi:HK97 family phage major capsid protein
MTALASAALDRIRTIAQTAMPPRLDDRIAREYSLARALAGLREQQRAGFEFEVHQDLLRNSPRALSTPNSLMVPWGCLATRADTVATASTGGYLVETINAPVVPALASASVLVRAGATVIPAKVNFNVPKINTPVTGTWLGTETTQLTEAEQVFGQMAMTQHTVGGYTEISRQLLLQSSSGDESIRRNVTGAVARAIDKGGIVGTGANGQPTGIANVGGTNTFSGTTATLAALTGGVLATGDALTVDSMPAFVSGRTAANTLRNRSEITNSSKTLWQGPISQGLCVDYPGFSTSSIGATNLYFGNFAFVVIALFGDLELAINPYAGFQAGLVGVRVMASADIGVTYPSAFSVNSSAIS